MSNLNIAVERLAKGEHPGLEALHEVRKAADVSIQLALLEAALLRKAIADGNQKVPERLVRSLASQVMGGHVVLMRVRCVSIEVGSAHEPA